MAGVSTTSGSGLCLRPEEPPDSMFSYGRHFKYCYTTSKCIPFCTFHAIYLNFDKTVMNWRHGGHLLRSHRVPVVTRQRRHHFRRPRRQLGYSWPGELQDPHF
jgi:hypothetical protein